MATIGKIRERSGLVIILIGIAMLGFIATDFITNGFKISNGSQNAIGTVYGEKIEPAAFQQTYEAAMNNQRSQMGENAEITAYMQGQISSQVWDQMVNTHIVEREAGKLGLQVTGDEIRFQALNPDPNPLIVQVFTGGHPEKYNAAEVKSFFDNFSTQPDEMQQNWERFEDEFVDQRLSEKITAMVNNSIFATDLEAVENFDDQNKTVSFQFVPLYMNAIPDNQVNVDESDYQEYYDAHKEEFKKTESRTFQYVEFSIMPTLADTMAAREWMMKQAENFKKTANDSAFVAGIGNSTFSGKYLPRGSYPATLEDQIFTADKGTVLGPVLQNGQLVLVKVLDSKPDSVLSYHASHILIRPSGATAADTAAAMKKAQELMASIKGGEDFAKVAQEESQDPGSASKGGDLGWFHPETMVKAFGNAVKTMHKGDMRIVKTEFGVHIIKADDNPSDKLVKAAVLEKPIMAGNETVQNGYNLASKFRSSVNNLDEFNNLAKKDNITVRLAENIGPNDYTLAGLENPRDLIRWAFNSDTKVGDITDPRQVGQKYVIAILTNITKAGYQDLNAVKDQIKAQVLAQKKRDMLADRLKEAMEKNSNNLQGIANAVKSSVNSVENTTFTNPDVPNLANEPKVIGYVFGAKKGKIQGPVTGESGAFVVMVTGTNSIQPPQSMETQRMQLQKQSSGNAITAAMDALKEKANVKDYRYMYY